MTQDRLLRLQQQHIGHQDKTVDNLHRRCPRDGLDDEKAGFVKKLAQLLANVVKAATSATSSTTSSSIFSGSVIACVVVGEEVNR